GKGEFITVGEAWGANIDNANLYSNPDGSEFSMVFQFEHIGLDQQEGKEKWDLAPLPFIKLKQVLTKWQEALDGSGWNSLFWDNHDLPRIVSRWGNDQAYRKESAKMLAVVLHGMQGTRYIYQGEELGMTNVQYPIEDYEDLETLNMYHERKKQGYQEEGIMRSIHAKSRDNARTPMQWDASDNAGFTTGTPWLKVNPNYIEINAKDNLEDPDSVFACYQKLIALRKSYPVFVDGHFRLLLEEDENFFAYMREDENSELLVVVNFFDQQVNLPLELDLQDYTILYQNYKDTSGNLYRPYEARIYYKQK
ncbi:MAG TPA: glucohydrolase, partial [Erysipelotrichaceae bacterium]|nr:glucohydrolase [Erysipelotrichaceae bacterium]